MKLDEAKEVLKQHNYIMLENKYKNAGFIVEDADKSAKVTKPINEEIGQGETTWIVDKLKPDFENLANYVSDAASEWLDNNEDDANTEDLCKYIADFIVERKETVLKEFGKAVIYTILKEWYICDDDDVNKLVDSVESYIEDDL